MAARLLALLLVLVLVLLAVSVVVGLLAYGTTPARTGRVDVPALGAEATVRWVEDRPTIEAQSLGDAYAALGYVHALEATWTMTLWRQAASGRLAAWFGDAARPYDLHALTLGFAAQGRAAYEALPPEQQALLDAYASGVNRALLQPAVAQTDEFVLRDVEPEPWQPWDALAVERLLAYFGTEAPALLHDGIEAAADTTVAASVLRSLAASDEARAFAGRDRLFRAALFLGNFRASYAWTAPHVAVAGEDPGRTWMVRIGYGTSALPLVSEVTVTHRGRWVTLATIPGTVVFPAALAQGPDGPSGWLVLLTSPLAASLADQPLPTQHARLLDRVGREQLVGTRRDARVLALTTPPEPQVARADTLSESTAAPDTLRDATAAPSRPYLALRWRGFGAASDTGAWAHLLTQELGLPRISATEALPAFSLFDGDGLRLDASGTTTVLGAPAVRRPIPGGTFVGGEPALQFAASRLSDLLDTAPVLTPLTLATDRYSAWAARAVPSWVRTLDDDLTPAMEDADAYLGGWSFDYAPRAIAPTLFDRWAATYARTTSRGPDRDTPPLALDSTAAIAARVSLARALDTLRTDFGSEPTAWRWENAQPSMRRFPIWSSPTDTLVHGPAERRYAPVRLSLGGHPTTLAGGTSPAFPGQGSAAGWTAWIRSDAPTRTTSLHPTITTRGPLARALDALNLDQPRVRDRPGAEAPTLRLVPVR
ncbi:MAG: penicillin acylase family protein [Bacteroidota bacterium]